MLEESGIIGARFDKAMKKLKHRMKDNKKGDFTPVIKFSDLKVLMAKYEREDMDDECLQSLINTYSTEKTVQEDVEETCSKEDYDKQ
jgi:hypothetical protein